uniref:Uncharacterized protein n=1 Tax=Panagrolaimus superbus TaxID=310955 RepID=A0A914Z3A7_9BILA
MANVSSKFWITDTINIYDEIDVAPNRLSSIIPKVYQANITKLNLKNQIISYSDFLFLSSNVENIDMFCTTVKAGNDSIVPLEKLVNGLPKIKSLWFFDNSSASSITTTTFKKLLENPHFFKCAEIVMQNLPEKFDIETFFSYAKKNQTTKIFLHFNDSTSEAYKTRLETFIDLVVASQTHNYLPPLIHSPRIDDERWQKITSLYHTY